MTSRYVIKWTSKHFSPFEQIDNSINFYFHLNFFLSTGEKWKTRRKLLTPTFHFRILHDFVEVFNKQAGILAKKLEVHADGKTVVNVFSDIALCTLDVICGKRYCYLSAPLYGKGRHFDELSVWLDGCHSVCDASWPQVGVQWKFQWMTSTTPTCRFISILISAC